MSWCFVLFPCSPIRSAYRYKPNRSRRRTKMASIDVDESSKRSPYKKHDELFEQQADSETSIPKYHQNFFTLFDDEEDEDFIPELITTGKDPQNHNIEVELGRNDERPKRNMTGRTERGNLGLRPINPPLPIKIDLNNNYKSLEATFSTEFKEFPDLCLKTAEHAQHHLLSRDLSNEGFTFGSNQAGGLPSSSLQYSAVFGTDIDDIPTSYNIPKLADHELPVVGTFVHGNIIPGFPYRTRLNGSSEFLFDGKALVLKDIGQGYGKRLSFESDDLLYDKNYFWSDNNPPHGYALSIALSISGEFEVKNEIGESIGNVNIKAVHDHQTIRSVRFFRGYIQIEVQLQMVCSSASLPNKDTTERILGGVAIATMKERKIEVAVIKKVSIIDFENYFKLEKIKERY